jgi:hypothetical protein
VSPELATATAIERGRAGPRFEEISGHIRDRCEFRQVQPRKKPGYPGLFPIAGAGFEPRPSGYEPAGSRSPWA